MEDSRDIYKFFKELFTLYGIVVVMIMFITVIVTSISDEVAEVSTMFRLGSEGISMATLVQLLGMTFLISVYRLIFMTDACNIKMSFIKRMVVFFSLAFITAVVFSIIFKWFPINSLTSWIGFVVSYIVAVYKSTAITKRENQKMQEALEKYNREHGITEE
jgi:hypothetical protein